MSPTGIVRSVFAAGTALFAALGLVLRDDPRWFAASGLCGLLWGGWGFLTDYVLHPLAAWSGHMLMRITGGGPAMPLRPTVEDTIRSLESRLDTGASRESDIRAALVLEELYRTVRKDPVNAARVLAAARARYPDAPELNPDAGGHARSETRGGSSPGNSSRRDQ